jgi:hypothetical protein
MKKLTITLLASLSLATASFAGQEVYVGKDSKAAPPLVTCFNDQELQLDIFGLYQDGNSDRHAGPIKDHGWGGGLAINYFFSRYIGIGAEGYHVRARDNGAAGGDHDGITNINGMLIFRLPIDDACIAPYAFLGGGASINEDGDDWAVGFGGIGLEYRVVPNKVGLFVDARWNYYGDRYGNGDQNNFLGRAGVRWVF